MAIAVLAACETPVPDSGAGVGFGDYDQYREQRLRRNEVLQGSGSTVFPTAPVVSAELIPSATIATPGPTTQAIPASDLAAAGIGGNQDVGAPLSAIDPNLGRATGLQATPTNATPTLTGNPGISDEQDFGAVASRESIESDAERRAAQAAAREIIAPTALPTRPSDTGPNIVAYALNAPNAKGQEWYSRSILSGQGRFQRNCVSYRSPDAAQRDFLARGGPERDPRGIDPDGDGFACGWDPAPFRLAAGN